MKPFCDNRFGSVPGVMVLALMLVLDPACAFAAALKITKSSFDPAQHTLLVTGSTDAKLVKLYDKNNHQWLNEAIPRMGNFSFKMANLPEIPCTVQLKTEDKTLDVKIKGNPACSKGNLPPSCQIVSPGHEVSVSFGQAVKFVGRATDPEHTTLRYEWDFGGGADIRPTTADAGNVVFGVRDNAHYMVSFSAINVQGKRCADRVQVTVGTPPSNLPAKVSEQAAPTGTAMDNPTHAVMPFQPFGMAFHDLSYGYYSMLAPTNWVNAAVIKKGSIGANKPVLLGPEDVTAQYSAASSPWDPSGSGSINSTSRNYPVGNAYGESLVKKSDWFDPCLVWYDTNPATQNRSASDTQYISFFDTYLAQASPSIGRVKEPRPGIGVSGDLTNAECTYSNFFYPNWNDDLLPYDPANPSSFAYTHLESDDGTAFWSYDMISRFDPVHPNEEGFTGFRGVLPPNGSPMPGRDAPYQANAPQAFLASLQKETSDNYEGYDGERKFFAAKGIPSFPTDDQGRHNAYPLMRIQAHDKSGKLLATADAVTAVTTEFKCAECHTKGKNGSDQAVYDGLLTDMGMKIDSNGQLVSTGVPVKEGLEKYKGREKWIPRFVAPEDVDAARKNDRDVIEQAAMINIARLHDFYYNFIEDSGWLGPLELESEQLVAKNGKVHAQPGNCTDYCHKSVPRADPRRYNMAPIFDGSESGACPEMSDSLHNIHGRLIGTMNADFTGSIERNPINRELKLLDLTKNDPANPPKLLLAVKDTGTPDDSCFFCHAGKQDKYQRDVMSNAGVNCIDCHGDLAVLAGGGAMVSRGHGANPLDSRDPATNLNTAITRKELADAYMAWYSSYGRNADGNWYFLEKDKDGQYRHDGEVVSSLDMALAFIGGEGKDNGDGTYTLTDDDKKSETVTEKQLLKKESLKKTVNGWNLHFLRIPWAEELSCANCHTGDGSEPVRRRAYDMTTGTFKLQPITNERFAENIQPKQHDSSFTLVVQKGENCPPGTFSDTVTSEGKHVCQRGLFKDSIDRHGKVPCEACHGATHAVWPNPDPYANDNVTAMQLQGHTGTILECNVCHTPDAFKDGRVDGLNYDAGILAGPHNLHPVNDPYWWKSTDDTLQNGGHHNQWAKSPGKSGEDQCAACHGADHKGTRLSKTPVDRVFQAGKARNFEPIVVKAGTQISCDLCHDIEQSFKK